MSDKSENQFYTGNFAEPLSLPGHGGRNFALYPSRRRLVEECSVFTLADLRSIYKRRDLLRLADTYQPATFRLGGHRFSLHLIAEILPRPKNNRQTGDETIRIWMTCPACFQRIRKVYTFLIDQRSCSYADLKCRQCHGLTYLSKNCCGNLWWRGLAMPLKRALRRRQRLLLQHSARSKEQLENVEEFIWILRERATMKKRPYQGIPQNAHRKRPYRDLSLVQ
jgi:hypothetical protein